MPTLAGNRKYYSSFVKQKSTFPPRSWRFSPNYWCSRKKTLQASYLILIPKWRIPHKWWDKITVTSAYSSVYQIKIDNISFLTYIVFHVDVLYPVDSAVIKINPIIQAGGPSPQSSLSVPSRWRGDCCLSLPSWDWSVGDREKLSVTGRRTIITGGRSPYYQLSANTVLMNVVN